MLVVLESTTAGEYQLETLLDGVNVSGLRWSIPERWTMELPPVAIESNLEGGGYRVVCDGIQIGIGVARNRERPLRVPDAFLPALVDPDSTLLGPAGLGWPGPITMGGLAPVKATGPALLPGNRPVMDEPKADFMTLDITQPLAAALVRKGIISEQVAEAWKEQPIRITLRYAAFGSYVGVSPMRTLPVNKAPGDWHLFNVLMVLERLD